VTTGSLAQVAGSGLFHWIASMSSGCQSSSSAAVLGMQESHQVSAGISGCSAVTRRDVFQPRHLTQHDQIGGPSQMDDDSDLRLERVDYVRRRRDIASRPPGSQWKNTASEVRVAQKKLLVLVLRDHKAHHRYRKHSLPDNILRRRAVAQARLTYWASRVAQRLRRNVQGSPSVRGGFPPRPRRSGRDRSGHCRRR
jgi:hypothetical protein